MPQSGLTIVSGGQTGVDRAALDAALALGVSCGGWCPDGRLDENGRIPDRYLLTELAGGGFAERTIKNVEDSDGTLIICFREPRGGTKTTVDACSGFGKPSCIVDGSKLSTEQGVEVATQFVREKDIRVLNVAGPRASEEPGAYAFAFAVVTGLLKRLGCQNSQ